jgi:hypothetical protein
MKTEKRFKPIEDRPTGLDLFTLVLFMLLAGFIILALASCGLHAPPEWEGTPDPLENRKPDWHSPAWGTFGPGGAHTPYRPELDSAPQ